LIGFSGSLAVFSSDENIQTNKEDDEESTATKLQ